MIDYIEVKNIADLETVSGKKYAGDIDVIIEQGKLNRVDPRVLYVLEYLYHAVVLAAWSSPQRPLGVSGFGAFKFKDKQDLLSITISFSGKYRYMISFDSGYYSEDPGGGIMSESIETSTKGVILEYNYLDELWKDGKMPTTKCQPLVNFGEKAFLYRDILKELKDSFVFLDWSSNLMEGTTLRTIRERLSSVYYISNEYIQNVWEKWMPTLDLGIDKIEGDSILIRSKTNDEYFEMPLVNCGSGALMLFRALPILLLPNRTIVLNQRCSTFPELHPILKRYLLEDILYNEKDSDSKTRTVILSDEE